MVISPRTQIISKHPNRPDKVQTAAERIARAVLAFLTTAQPRNKDIRPQGAIDQASSGADLIARSQKVVGCSLRLRPDATSEYAAKRRGDHCRLALNVPLAVISSHQPDFV